MTDETTATREQLEELPGSASALMIQIMQQSARDAAYTTNELLAGYQREAQEANATIEAIRRRLQELMTGDYMPTPYAVLQALYPSRERIERYMPEEGR